MLRAASAPQSLTAMPLSHLPAALTFFYAIILTTLPRSVAGFGCYLHLKWGRNGIKDFPGPYILGFPLYFIERIQTKIV